MSQALTERQSKVMNAVMREIRGQSSIANILTMRPEDVGLSLRQLERMGLVELTFEKVNRSRSSAIAAPTFIGRVVGADLDITISEVEHEKPEERS